jgi:hypothetical protein
MQNCSRPGGVSRLYRLTNRKVSQDRSAQVTGQTGWDQRGEVEKYYRDGHIREIAEYPKKDQVTETRRH